MLPPCRHSRHSPMRVARLEQATRHQSTKTLHARASCTPQHAAARCGALPAERRAPPRNDSRRSTPAPSIDETARPPCGAAPFQSPVRTGAAARPVRCRAGRQAFIDPVRT
ncbi:hypothetical protein D8O27_12900 [Burkholderia mallei]|uniref:Uncharacterized protein n=2 Tax=Burkholderia mallei TaxID=13373 RepID=A0AAX1XAL3_BURML|nr:hypothetical protein BMAA1762 [Burkholderia mallei ATCC 23344]RKN98526.1 hypothetical protein D8O31_12150 [Burkholderia mallei]RKO01583.1 hypothetical protein D8O03_13435 [Burkholderia mallei]RKO08119.1 hypothetical protein D8O05_04345 [Burkholderia mallei]RKO12048.1 hypothetical protein D8O04_15625 [Burkholderia mallei]